MISKALSTSEKRAALHEVVPELAEFCQQLYPLIVAHADDFGRLPGDAFTVKHAIDPTSPRRIPDFERGLKALHDVGLITWYQVNSRYFIQVNNFEAHQQGLHKRTRSVYPDTSGNIPTSPEIPSEEKRTEQKRTDSPEAQSTSGQTTTFLDYPIVGTGGSVWQLSEAQVVEWVGLFPGIDVRQELRKALAWVLANPGRRKTLRGMPRYLALWLSRATDRGHGAAASEPVQARDTAAHRLYDAMRFGR